MSRLLSRRTILRDLASGAAALPLLSLPARLAASPAPLPRLSPEAPADEDYWSLVRAQFAFRDDRVPMNAANLCPSPMTVADEVTRLTRDIDEDCSFQNRDKFTEMLEASRSLVAEALGVDADEVALVRNTSEANNTINAGLPLEHGDEVVVWDQNHPTNNVAWDVRAARYGIRVTRVSVPGSPASAADLVEPFVSAFTDRTRVVTLTHVSNLSGIRLPVRAIADAAHQRGIHVHLDGAQSFGAEPLDLRALGCDSYSSSAHKWFMGPKEAGILYVRREFIPSIWAAGVAPGWGSDADTDLEGARKFESLGQRDDACLAAMATTARFHATVGPDRIGARVSELATAIKEGVAAMGLPLVTPMDPALSGGVCIVEVAGDRQAVFQAMYREHGIAGAPTGGLRLSPHVYNTMEHVERALAGIRVMEREIRGA
jgi:selenocysteine lyase/cysteine desulfurase